uniref:Uncharacterized protein n=1 Tax=Salix viminalis TaxID=40686 RepID=A0A6N2ML96_SALVM
MAYNSMTPNLMSHFGQCGMTKHVWDAVKRSYLDASNSSQFGSSQQLCLATSPLLSLEEERSLVH